MRTARQTDRHDESNGRFSQFLERASNVVRFQGTRVKVTSCTATRAVWP